MACGNRNWHVPRRGHPGTGRPFRERRRRYCGSRVKNEQALTGYVEKRPTTCRDAEGEHHLQDARSNTARRWLHAGRGAESGCSSVSPAAALSHSHRPHGGPGGNKTRPFPAGRDRAAAGPLPTTSRGIYRYAQGSPSPKPPGKQPSARASSRHSPPGRSGKAPVPAHGVARFLYPTSEGDFSALPPPSRNPRGKQDSFSTAMSALNSPFQALQCTVSPAVT